jgi:pimeloyl-ACP methyl ester carboxylesterase
MPGVQRWNSAAQVGDLSAPVLIQHGTADQLIPISNGLRLSELMQIEGLPVTFEAVPGATHNNLPGHPEYAGRIDAFLADVQTQ